MATTKLTQERIRRILARCTTPAAASKAAERIWAIARRRGAEARMLGALAGALHEQRHVILRLKAGDKVAARAHAERVQDEIGRVLAEVAR